MLAPQLMCIEARIDHYELLNIIATTIATTIATPQYCVPLLFYRKSRARNPPWRQTNVWQLR